MFKLLDTVALARDLQASGLQRGDLGAIVHVHGPDAFEVEFVAASGRTLALLTLQGGDLRPLGDRDLLSVREVAETLPH
jgi:Domain of unknown function (DUF4926)